MALTEQTGGGHQSADLPSLRQQSTVRSDARVVHMMTARASFFLLGGMLSALCTTHTFAKPLLPRTVPAAQQTETSDDERTQYIQRALSPRHPANVQGLRLTGTGTGFFIARQGVITNFHVAG